jgi:RIO kinase 1
MPYQTNIPGEWLKKYPDIKVVSKLKSGKEADVWLVRANHILYALKVYVTGQLSTRSRYTEGQWITESSLRKAVRQKTKVGKNLQQKLWTKREYYLLKKLHSLGANVPEVFAYTDTAILMQYLGSEQEPAPRLIDIELDGTTKQQVLKDLEKSLRILFENGVVHADLSPYNILWWNNKPWIIDFPQATDMRRNPNWQEFYKRDLANISKYFRE